MLSSHCAARFHPPQRRFTFEGLGDSRFAGQQLLDVGDRPTQAAKHPTRFQWAGILAGPFAQGLRRDVQKRGGFRSSHNMVYANSVGELARFIIIQKAIGFRGGHRNKPRLEPYDALGALLLGALTVPQCALILYLTVVARQWIPPRINVNGISNTQSYASDRTCLHSAYTTRA